MKRLLGVLVLVALFSLGMAVVCFAAGETGAAVTAQPEQFSGIAVESLSGSATVQDIDYTTRRVTLKYDDNGNTETFAAGPEVKNFNQVNKGDKVNIDYDAAVELSIGGPAEPVRREAVVEVERAPLGQKPAETVRAYTDISAVIEDVDYVNGLVTVRGPERTLIMKVGPRAGNLEKIKKGDEVFLRITEALTIKVVAPPQDKPKDRK